MATLTIFTPTYNRAHILHKCYESLKRQACKDFVWLVIDDGSVDNTKELVQEWIKEGQIPITYYYQKNQGMHSGHNAAYKLANTELCMCIDSDDYLTDNAVEYIVTAWKQNGSEKYAGMVCLNAYPNGDVIGEPLPQTLLETKFNTVYYKYRHDKKYIYRRDVFNKYPLYPVYSGEKLTPLSCKYFMIDDDYWLLAVHKVVCIVEYLEDGSTRNIFNHYRRNPRGIIYVKQIEMRHGLSLIHRLKAAIHYVAANIRLRHKNYIGESCNKPLVYVAIIPGVLLHFYITYCKKKNIY